MGFQEAINTCLSKPFSFSGRATRSEYWWFLLFRMIALFGAGVISGAIPSLAPLLGLLVAVSFLIGFPVAVRRLHDTNRSGLWLLVNFIGLGIIVLIFYCLPGTNRDKPNRYTEHDNRSYGWNP